MEAICVELERAARQYPPLFHQQLKPWSAKGEIRITEPQWAAFVENEGLSEDAWCDWHGPFDDFLGIWYGNPDEMEVFYNLSESIRVILQREDFSDIDPLDLPRDFDSPYGWTETLHKWALKFQLPLLRCDIDLWNSEGNDAQTFVRLTQTWGGVGDVPYPLHPVVNSLRDNVFTSSLAALRALLHPELVIETNEPWPLQDAVPAIRQKHGDPTLNDGSASAGSLVSPDEKQHVSDESEFPSDDFGTSGSAELVEDRRAGVHRLVLTPVGWLIFPATTISCESGNASIIRACMDRTRD